MFSKKIFLSIILVAIIIQLWQIKDVLPKAPCANNCPCKCSAPCDKTCTCTCYQCDKGASVRITYLPYSIDSINKACDSDRITALPFTVGGTKYTSIPITVTYHTCQMHKYTYSGPSFKCEYELIWWQEEQPEKRRQEE